MHKLIFIAAAGLVSATTAHAAIRLNTIKLPPGFSISVYSDAVHSARGMARGDKGTIFVGSLTGNVYALTDRNGDNKAEEVDIIARNLDMPVGVAFRDGSLYVSSVTRILRYDNIESSLTNPPQPVVVYDGFPSEQDHGWKFIAFGPDGYLYVPIGAPCNICDRGDPYATITRMSPDGTGFEIYARGIRNTVGFDWQPGTGILYFTDNGRDLMGDNTPSDELNRAPKPGLHFGYPYFHGTNIPDPEFGKGHNPADYVVPVQDLGPHVAALGMRFYTGTRFPAAYRNQVFIAEHGSWNRTEPIGYRVTMVTLEGGRATSYAVFAEGWLQNGKAWGRPVDVLVMPDGALLVSDDKAGAVYRISYGGK